MSCILRLFKKKSPKPSHQDSRTFSVVVDLESPLPDGGEELYALEEAIGQRMTYLKKKSTTAYTNAAHAQTKGDMRKYLNYMTEAKRYAVEINKLGIRHTEIVEKQNKMRFSPPLRSPSTKFDPVQVLNPVQEIRNVSNHSSSKLVSTRPLDRPRTHNADFIPPPSPHIRGRSQWS